MHKELRKLCHSKIIQIIFQYDNKNIDFWTNVLTPLLRLR